VNIEVRSIAPADAERINELSAQLGYSLPVSATIERIKEIMASVDHIAFVAITDGKIVGWIHGFKTLLLESEPFIEIGGFVVDENFRSQGIGGKLVQRIKDWSRDKNVYDLRVRSNVKRSGAHRFYISQGFAEKKEQKVFQVDL
jgi:GNAT superfamily N-acetyltransferase